MNRLVKGMLPARAHTERGASGTGFASGVMVGTVLSLACTVASALLAALIAYLQSDPDALILPLGFAVAVLSPLVGGLGIGLKCKSGILPCALLCGCIYVGIGLLIGFLFFGTLRQTLSLGLGLGASLGIRAGLVALFCASAALTRQIRDKIGNQPKRRHH